MISTPVISVDIIFGLTVTTNYSLSGVSFDDLLYGLVSSAVINCSHSALPLFVNLIVTSNSFPYALQIACVFCFLPSKYHINSL